MKKIFVCPVCGFKGLEQQVFVNGEYLNTFEICSCCGFEFGFSEDHRVVHGFICIPEEFIYKAAENTRDFSRERFNQKAMGNK